MTTRHPPQERPFSNNGPAPQGEKGYPWLFLHMRSSWIIGLAVVFVVCGLGGAFYIWYSQSGFDTSPDSWAGLSYAVVGTLCLFLAVTLYSLRRRLRKGVVVGQLNSSLKWHVLLAVMGLIVLTMHAFGHFAPISGTFALYSVIVLVISGFVGRALDYYLPRLITREVDKVLTLQGGDRIDSVSQKLQAIVVHNTQENRGIPVNSPHPADMSLSLRTPAPNGLPFASNGRSLGASWDLAYISLEPTQQELDHNAPQYRFIPDKKSALNRPGAFMPGAEEHLLELEEMQLAMRREQLYRYIIRYWRVLHILLAFITIGLVTWHIIFASTLLAPGFFH
jgi:hypothetical protein